ncbi:c-type cytochrome [Octadecabacter sp. R77987]|uniref:c-type cytochrome n=1 Tax=Octadecabacter sp. R77987 TaxID=3093874 RepID=UPI00366B0057
MNKIGYVTAALAMTLAVAAYAHNGATGIVKERMDAMMAMGNAVKALAPMMRGETAYDADAVRIAAATFTSHAGESMTALFPEGTGGSPSAAKDAVWEDWDEFVSLAEQLATYSAGLALAADNPPIMATGDMSATMMGGETMMGEESAAMMGVAPTLDTIEFAAMPVDGAFEMVSQSCSACHAKFRIEAN